MSTPAELVQRIKDTRDASLATFTKAGLETVTTTVVEGNDVVATSAQGTAYGVLVTKALNPDANATLHVTRNTMSLHATEGNAEAGQLRATVEAWARATAWS